jgi:hypothetical protein
MASFKTRPPKSAAGFGFCRGETSRAEEEEAFVCKPNGSAGPTGHRVKAADWTGQPAN